MNVKIKKLTENAVIPKYSKIGDAGMDLTVTSIELIDSEHIKYGFGISVEIPRGYVGLIFPRSSIYKQKQVLTNSEKRKYFRDNIYYSDNKQLTLF